MDRSLTIASFNVHGFKSSTPEIAELCSISDIVFLQETWLPKQESYIVGSISENFMFSTTHSFDLSDGPRSGRPYGGMCVLWRKSLSQCIRYVDFSDHRLIGILYENSRSCSKWLIIGVYFPYECSENFEEYIEYLGKLSAICSEWSDTQICVIGDFNAHVGK